VKSDPLGPETVNPRGEARTPPPLAFVIPNEAAQLKSLRANVCRQLEEIGIDEKAVYAVDLTLEELGGNVLRYGYDAGVRGEIRVEIATTRTAVVVVLLDDARPFDPTLHAEPRFVGRVGDAPIGGRGISMVRRSTRAMRYRRESGLNRVEVEVARAMPPD
jgi:anti-sigma regulatory factor (Ser/Thr protein kinase)